MPGRKWHTYVIHSSFRNMRQNKMAFKIDPTSVQIILGIIFFLVTCVQILCLWLSFKGIFHLYFIYHFYIVKCCIRWILYNFNICFRIYTGFCKCECECGYASAAQRRYGNVRRRRPLGAPPPPPSRGDADGEERESLLPSPYYPAWTSRTFQGQTSDS